MLRVLSPMTVPQMNKLCANATHTHRERWGSLVASFPACGHVGTRSKKLTVLARRACGKIEGFLLYSEAIFTYVLSSFLNLLFAHSTTLETLVVCISRSTKRNLWPTSREKHEGGHCNAVGGRGVVRCVRLCLSPIGCSKMFGSGSLH